MKSYRYRIYNANNRRCLKYRGDEWLDFDTARLYLADMAIMRKRGYIEVKEEKVKCQ